MRVIFCKIFNIGFRVPGSLMALGLAVCLSAIAPPADLAADTLRMKNGTLYKNVIVIVLSGQAAVVRKNGRTTFVKLNKIRRISHRRVSWKQRIKNKTVIVKVVDRDAMEKRVLLLLEENRKAREAKRQALSTRTASMWRSVILPGWGQVHDGDTALGYSLMGVFGGMLLGYNATRTSYQTAQDDYAELTTPYFLFLSTQGIVANYLHFEERRTAIESSARRANAVSALVVFFWASIAIISFTGVLLDLNKPPGTVRLPTDSPAAVFAADVSVVQEARDHGEDRRVRFMFRSRF